MKRVIFYTLSAMIGICVGVFIHCTFMIVEAEGCLMLPSIEPGQQVVVCLRENNIKEGDIVAAYSPYYTIEGDGKIIFRRVKQVDDKGLILAYDTATIKDEEMFLSREELLGKVLLLDIL